MPACMQIGCRPLQWRMWHGRHFDSQAKQQLTRENIVVSHAAKVAASFVHRDRCPHWPRDVACKLLKPFTSGRHFLGDGHSDQWPRGLLAMATPAILILPGGCGSAGSAADLLGRGTGGRPSRTQLANRVDDQHTRVSLKKKVALSDRSASCSVP